MKDLFLSLSILLTLLTLSFSCKRNLQKENTVSVPYDVFIEIEPTKSLSLTNDFISFDESDATSFSVGALAGIVPLIVFSNLNTRVLPNSKLGTFTHFSPNDGEWKDILKSKNISDRIVAHVGVEYGEDIVGGAGVVANNLSVASNEKAIRAIAITPYYDFHNKDKNMKFVGLLSHPFQGRKVESKIFMKMYKNVPRFFIKPDPKFAEFPAKDIKSIYSVKNQKNTSYFDISSAALAKHLDEIGINVKTFQTHYSGNHAIAMNALRNSKAIKILITQHDITFQSKEKIDKSSLNNYFKGLLSENQIKKISGSSLASNSRFADYVLPVSGELKKMSTSSKHANSDIRKTLSSLGDRYKVISNGIMNENIKNYESVYDLKDNKFKAKEKLLSKVFSSQELANQNLIDEINKPIFLYVGRWSKEKGIEDIEKASKIIGERGRLIVMTNTSKDDAYLREVSSLSNVRVINGIDNQKQRNLGDIVREAADLAFVPSREESFGMVALEGILNGQIVVSTGRQGLKEVLEKDIGSKKRTYDYLSNQSMEKAINHALEVYKKDISKSLIWNNYQIYNNRYNYSSLEGPFKDLDKIYSDSIADADIYKVTNGKDSRVIRFYARKIPGLQIDKKVFLQSLQGIGFEIQPLYDVDDKTLVDLNIHIQNTGQRKNAKENWILVNQEWIRPNIIGMGDKLSSMDRILCRHALCEDLVKRIIPIKDFKKVEKISFSSLVQKSSSDLDYNMFFHPAGKSEEKNTAQVLNSWLRHPEWPPIVVTCFQQTALYGCLSSIKKKVDMGAVEKAPNIILHTKRLSEKDFEKYSKSGVVVMPSRAEGWGHAINEARAKGQVVITLDESPMKQHVRHGTGFAVKSHYDGTYWHSGAPMVRADVKELEKTVKEFIAMPKDQKENMSKRTRDLFRYDTEMFISQMSDLFQETTKLQPNKSQLKVPVALDNEILEKRDPNIHIRDRTQQTIQFERWQNQYEQRKNDKKIKNVR